MKRQNKFHFPTKYLLTILTFLCVLMIVLSLFLSWSANDCFTIVFCRLILLLKLCYMREQLKNTLVNMPIQMWRQGSLFPISGELGHGAFLIRPVAATITWKPEQYNIKPLDKMFLNPKISLSHLQAPHGWADQQ